MKVWPYRLRKNGGYVFCSRICAGKYNMRIRKINPAKSAEARVKISTKAKGRKCPWTTIRNITNNPVKRGEENYQWKGNNTNYRNKHAYILKKFGRPTHCEICGKEAGIGDRRKTIHWANKTGNYLRELKGDWIMLCTKCHGLYDSNRRRNNCRYYC